jgi:hypothetical protein
MIEVRVAHLGLDRGTNAPVVVLREVEGPRILPIWIGPGEASAIAMELAGVKYNRPLTHDLLKQVIVGLGGELRKVLITAVRDSTYFAELFQVDARPSDSIALALRLRAPVYAAAALLELVSPNAVELQADQGALDSEALKTYLQNLDPEDFGKFTP